MSRRVGLVVLASLLVLLVILSHVPATAQGGPNARSSANLHMRTGPGKNYPSTTIIGAGTGLFLEARAGDTSWLLAHTEDGQFRGWITNLRLRFAPGFSAATLPVSAEIVNPPRPAAPAGPANPTNPPNAPNPPEATSAPAHIRLSPNSAALNQRLRGIYFYEAAKSLPDNGVVQDAFHLTHREDWSILFTGDQYRYGEALLELLTLQMLDDIRRNVF